MVATGNGPDLDTDGPQHWRPELLSVVVRIRSVAWLSDIHVVIPALVLVDTWQWTPMVSLICLAGLSALPIEPFEAAMIDGASVWQRFWKLTLPMVWPTLLVAILFRFIDLLKVIEHIYVMTRGGPGFASRPSTSTTSSWTLLLSKRIRFLHFGRHILVLGASLMLIVRGGRRGKFRELPNHCAEQSGCARVSFSGVWC
jgi:multiple sugar transport system permease protein